MPTKERIDAQTLYANILAEINFRVDAINHCTLGFSRLPPPFVKEFCYLQIRMICELVALGCLVAHGDIKETSSQNLQGAWSAERIMSALEQLHPHFYPQPARQIKTDYGFQVEAIPSPLTKTEFLKLYYKCGEMLHRGNLRKLLKGQFPTQINFPEITEKAQKIINLLSHHVLFMKNGEQMFIALLKEAGTMKPQVAIAEAPKDGQLPDFLQNPQR